MIVKVRVTVLIDNVEMDNGEIDIDSPYDVKKEDAEYIIEEIFDDMWDTWDYVVSILGKRERGKNDKS